VRTACQRANSIRHYDELFAPTTAGACGRATMNPPACHASDEGVGSANSLSECQFNAPLSSCSIRR
jgi:hypothetical protein